MHLLVVEQCVSYLDQILRLDVQLPCRGIVVIIQSLDKFEVCDLVDFLDCRTQRLRQIHEDSEELVYSEELDPLADAFAQELVHLRVVLNFEVEQEFGELH